MKRRLSAVLLALGLTVSALSTGVYAAETETTAATEQVTEAATEAATEQETEAVTEKATEAATEAAAVAELESEIAELESEAAQAETETLSEEEQMKQQFAQMLTQIASYTDEQLAQMMESDDATTRLLAVNWSSVKEEVGAFSEVTSIETSASEDGYTYIITCHTKYEKTGDTDVVVSYEYDMKEQKITYNWDVQYSMGKQIERAALNTAMGMGIVFLVLVFLILVIGRLHIIPDMIEKKAKANAPEPAPAPAAPVAAAVVEEEEDLMDDLELVAVITAAIAASETTSGDGFVVRSIKKANRRNWQRA